MLLGRHFITEGFLLIYYLAPLGICTLFFFIPQGCGYIVLVMYGDLKYEYACFIFISARGLINISRIITTLWYIKAFYRDI